MTTVTNRVSIEEVPVWRDIHEDGRWLVCDNFYGWRLEVKKTDQGRWKWDVFRIGAGWIGDKGYVICSSSRLPIKLTEHAVRWRRKYRLTLRGKWVLKEPGYRSIYGD